MSLFYLNESGLDSIDIEDLDNTFYFITIKNSPLLNKYKYKSNIEYLKILAPDAKDYMECFKKKVITHNDFLKRYNEYLYSMNDNQIRMLQIMLNTERDVFFVIDDDCGDLYVQVFSEYMRDISSKEIEDYNYYNL